MVSGGGRSAGLKSKPIVCATGNIATCVTPSGMPSSSAAARSFDRWAVVHTVPSPRERSARTKLHAAGRIDPKVDATAVRLSPSSRRSTHGITSTGTRSMVFASCNALWYTRFVCSSSSAPRRVRGR